MNRKDTFDRSALTIRALHERTHDLDLGVILPLGSGSPLNSPALRDTARRMLQARQQGAAVIFMMGGHVIRSGAQRHLIDLMERGLITLIAGNGSTVIHDYEFATIGATTESVARYIKTGEFGLWQETARINDIINEAWHADNTVGYGEAVGRALHESNLPHADVSVYGAAYRLGIPATVHVGIGHDIIHEHPNCDGAATGALSYNDFLRFAREVQRLEGGALLSFGSAVMAPEVFLKALSMARNRAASAHASIRDFLTLVCDLVDLPEDLSAEPPKNSPAYYFRPFKTLLVRTVADGGQSRYVRGVHAQTITGLWSAVNELEGKGAQK